MEDKSDLPLVDLSMIRCENCLFHNSCTCLRDDEKKNREMSKFISAFKDIGFLQVVGHTVDPILINNMFSKSREFFSGSDELKRSTCSKDRARRGYSASSSENFASLIGEKGKPNDTVEKFRFGPFIDASAIEQHHEYYNSKDGRVHFFPNNFENMPLGCEDAARLYYEQMTNLSRLVLALICFALHHPADYFGKFTTRHTSIASLNYYSPFDTLRDAHTQSLEVVRKKVRIGSTALEGESDAATIITRVAKHTDVSLLTIVAQKVFSERRNEWLLAGRGSECSVDGLQVHDAIHDRWNIVPYVADSLIINIGDCLQDWSRGTLRSAMHRVVTRSPVLYTAGAAHIKRLGDSSYTQYGSSEKCANEGADDDAKCSYESGAACEEEATEVDNESHSRYSLAFFFTPDHNAVILWPGDRTEDTEERVQTYSEWRKAHIAKAMRRQKEI